MKPRESALSHEMLTECLDYDPDTGIFTWKKVTSNRIQVGAVAGQLDRNGRRLINVNGLRYMAHRLAWFYVYKIWPEHEIDHMNLVKDDNRIGNLREATHHQNARNVVMRRNNKTGFKGVSYHSQVKNKFVAQITVNGRAKYIGLFDTPEEAHAAYVTASLEHHGEYGRLS